MTATMFSAAVLLLLVIDPFGNVPLVVATLAGTPPARRRKIIVRECLAAYVILLAFMLGGRAFLALLHLTDESLAIAGGVILFLIALRMVFPRPEGVFGAPGAGGEPMLVPLAVPMIAGPSALATVMLMASRDPESLGMWAGALTVTMALVTLVLTAGYRLERLLGERVMQAIGRLMGLILTAVAVEMLLGGIRDFVQAL